MELVAIQNRELAPELVEQTRFIIANTEIMHYELLKKKCIIPVFAKDNESTISHTEFIDLVMEVIGSHFRNESIRSPTIAVSHPVKGRNP
jgi:hypothetical protein